ncbi:Glyoxalase-like domain [Dermatophilus congolensis]|uniref:Glyoxalase-like domain n=1 Tax=Dermatophilus congolensis TaxID=1863 RepID=A0AA46H1J2_9MICO|nr:VOC family protein [Dermatophilus congolensis]STD15584.1 Glyoxalase-like domain [Dermatophilus congolensis]
MSDLTGMTIAINAGDTSEVLDFYTRVFGRGPDTAPMDDFLEWQISPGTWLQLSTGHDRPGANNARVRLEVADVEAAAERMRTAEVPIGDVVTVPDVVAFANFSDYWGNALGFYQLLTPRRILTPEERAEQEREHEQRLAARNAEEETPPNLNTDERLPSVPDDGSVIGKTGPTPGRLE